MKTIGLLLIAAIALPTVVIGADYAAWAKSDPGGSWTEVTEVAVRNSPLASLTPSDIERFCPSYSKATTGNRQRFWVGLLSAMARLESNFKPEMAYIEKFKDLSGNRVVSRGLLQISIESANSSKYHCGIMKPEDLHQPFVNLTCGVKILTAWIKDDGIIATYNGNNPKGGGRYWSVLREANGRLAEISGFTTTLPFCATAH